MKDTLKANTYLFNVMSSSSKNVKRLKTIGSYLLISGAFVQDARREKCIAMLNNIRNPKSSFSF